MADGAPINAGHMILNAEIFDYIEGDKNKQKLFNGRGVMELQRVRHNWTEHTYTHTHAKID